jgi:hypothetical protein
MTTVNFSSALTFSQSKQYLFGTDVNLPTDSNARRIDVWVKVQQSSGLGSIVEWGSESSQGGRFALMAQYDGKIYFSGEGLDLMGTTNIIDNLFHKVSIVFTGTEVGIYIDGKLDIQAPNSNLYSLVVNFSKLKTTDNDQIWIGNNPSGSEQFQGSIARIAVYNNSTLPDSNLDFSFSTASQSGLVSLYEFTDAIPRAYDQSSSSGNLSVFGNFSNAFAIRPEYSLLALSSSVNEGSTATFTLTTNVASGTSVSYILSGISAADVFGGSLSGTSVVNSSGVATISVPLLNDFLFEGSETLTITAGGATASTVVNDTSKTLTPTYSLTPATISVNEDSSAIFTLTTANVASGTAVPYTLSGISAADVSGGSLSGNAVVNSSGVATISVTLLNDSLTEGAETLTVTAGGATASTVVNDTSKSNTSTFPTVLTQEQMQNVQALVFTAFTPTESGVKWNFSSFFYGTNLLGKDFNLASFYGRASSIYDINALSIDDPDYLAIFDSNGNLISSSSEEKDWAAWVDSSGKAYDYDNIFSWSPPKDGTYYLGVVLSQTSSTPYYSFGGFETRTLVTSIPFGNGKYFYGSSGSDNVIGTSFVDVVKQTSTISSNQLTRLADGSWQVQNKLIPSNSDNLVNVERVEFNDMSVALDVSGPAGQVAKILGSVFGKSYVSNTVFAGIGLAYLDGGMTYLDLCGLAAGAAGLSTPDLLVTTLLRNTTGTEPTALIKSIYLQSISSGTSYASVVQQIADSSANTQSIKLIDLINTGLAYIPYIFPPTYNLSASSASVNEGATAIFNLTTTNVAVGAEVSYTISGVNPADLTTGTLTGKVTIGAGGTASISVPIAADGATEGQESLTISAQGATASIVINDISKANAAPTYTLTPATTSINEGVLAQVYVSTTNVAAGTSLQFGISGVGITQGDLIEGLFRFVTVDSTGKAVININTVADQLTEGPEKMYITLGTSTTSIIVNDTSILVGVIPQNPDGY